MKVAQINTSCGVGSTGKICVSISKLLNERNVENYILYSAKTNGYEWGISCSNKKYIKFQALKSKLFGNYGLNSANATKRMISELNRIQPDIVHLHNIHGHDCNLEMLLEYLKRSKVKVYWTFHDCWTFTGYCPYYVLAQCDKWKSECKHCVLRKKFSFIRDRSTELHERKKKAFSGLDMTIITPSMWLANEVKKSFLAHYPIKVINNGIDLNIFHEADNDFRKKYGIENKKMILGVADVWGKRKGFDVFLELAKRLPSDYRIVLVGTDKTIDKQLPSNIISIHRTSNQKELAGIYSTSDLYVNPTREEVFGMVNVEALACGTPVITFDTGGSPECIDETCGSVVECNDIDALEKEIIRVCETRPYSSEACIRRGRLFEDKKKFKEYVDLYSL